MNLPLNKWEVRSNPTYRISEFQEDEFVQKALAKGMDLREYAHHIESELDMVGQDHEDDYVHQSQAFVDLHGQIKSCDEILETMENLLSIFQTDLGNISTEIQTLQTKSVTMSIQLKNRMAVENYLNELLEGILVTPQLIRKIYDGEIDETWLGALAELNSKMHHAKARQGRHIRALKEVGPELERLRIKTVEKIREFLLSKIKSFRTPNTNVQIMQHSVLLKYKELNQFVMERYSEVALEIRQTYANTLRWYFSNQFETYATGLEKLHKYPYEALFRSFNLALIDNASSEFLFLAEYFSKRTQPDIEGIKAVFLHIFEPTLRLGLIARRYGEFAGSLLLLNDEQTDVLPRLAMLRLETSSLFEIMSKTFADTKSRLIFLINTFDLVLTLLADIRTNGVEAENDHWKQALHQTIALFVEEELKPYFGELISFIRMVDIAGGVSKVQLDHFERASFAFSNTWRQSLLSINASVIQHFSSFKNGTHVLHQVLGQLIVYYTRFHGLLDEKLQEQGPSTNTTMATSTRGWSHQPVGVQTVMVEVKKFRSNFLP
ncbi:Vacuolar protein sorting-associated protein 52 [Mortierella sp. NVP85]|nr:Vacuolar protein sorting-associated protein 52 [Mortierella sp. NVP85]